MRQKQNYLSYIHPIFYFKAKNIKFWQGYSFLRLQFLIHLSVKSPGWCSKFIQVVQRAIVFFFNLEHIEFNYSNRFYLFHDGGPYHIETSPFICRENQWVGFYMTATSVMKELNKIALLVPEKTKIDLHVNMGFVPAYQ